MNESDHPSLPVQPIQVGRQVPDFEMETYDPSTNDFGRFSLAEARARGRWTVLMFYPGDFTFVCATEFRALAEQHEVLQDAGYEVLSVSCDSKFTHLAWRQKEGELEDVQYPMAADPTGRIARLFGIYLEDAGTALRGTFLISPEGKLVGSEINELNVGRNMEELARKATAFVHFSKLPAEACPATWKRAGDKSLRPGKDLVGGVREALADGDH
jgi:peroxiredoxin (alkyl hydroperoxide reductase subunit C)